MAHHHFRQHAVDQTAAGRYQDFRGTRSEAIIRLWKHCGRVLNPTRWLAIVRLGQTRIAVMESILTLSDAKARLSEIVKKAIDGEEFIITRMGQPAVRISRYVPRHSAPKLGDLAGEIHIADDFDSWPPDIAEALGIAESE